ncbi:hypothetical protein [Streptomyces sp. NPDC018967]|uniref:hypothetical protein n=1 Tax=Streptomyces sp. NPDC018967 TaxID=3365059 RepID=UPI0037ADC9BD
MRTLAAQMGEWTFMPAPESLAPGAFAVLQRGGERVELRYSAVPLKDFLAAMSRIQSEFVRLSDAAELSAAHGTQERWAGIHA